ncbi:hypothetical protein J4204_01775 [Candidatus Woesearchaeota archaeon]|nr:hypothetical protein [Candidatus Woesearchaeota archaeon]
MSPKKIAVLTVLVFAGIFLFIKSYRIFAVYIAALLILEILSYFLIKSLKKSFQWLITPEDEHPEFSREGLKKFISHGYDPELGWARKPDTEKDEIGKFGITTYHIGKNGSRSNPGHESLPKKISFYGDSFIFGRQVNDNETCQWHLSELTKTNVLNFGVGNYGLDQSFLRLKREYPKNRTKIVIMAVVPSTIVRIMDMWKHYNEFGNTFGFKPRFILKNGKLKLVKNFIDNEDKFLVYKKYLPQIRKHDYFYENKFRKEMIRFPYFVSILGSPLRNIPLVFLVSWHKWFKKEKKTEVYPAPMKVIMHINLKLRHNLYRKNKYAVKLFEKLLDEFAGWGRKNKFVPVFLLMPQKDDLIFNRKRKKPYYGDFIESAGKKLNVIDLTPYLINRKDLDDIYSDDNKYGGHYSNHGSKVVAGIVYNSLKDKGLI